MACIKGDFAHAGRHNPAMSRYRRAKIEGGIDPRANRVRKIALTPVPSSGASQGDFAHPTELKGARHDREPIAIGAEVTR